MTADYSINLRDGSGRVATLFINGASVDELVAAGHEEWYARECLESNAFGRAISRGEIGDDAWIDIPNI